MVFQFLLQTCASCSSVLPISACAPAERASSSAQRSSLVRRRAAARSISSASEFSLLAILLRLALDGVAALRALAVLAFHLLHGFALARASLRRFR